MGWSQMGYTHYVGRVGALAVALGVGMAVAITPGVVWADETGEGTQAVDAGPTNPDPTNTSDGENDGGIVSGEPGGGTTTTTTTSGTQSTTVIGGGETPEVTISASTVDTSDTTTEQTPESATPIRGRWLELWEQVAQLILTPTTAEPNTAHDHDSVGDTSFAPSPTSVPTPALAAITPPATSVPTPALAAITPPASDPQPSTTPDGEPTGTTLLTMLTTVANDDGGAGQSGLRIMSLAGRDDTQAVIAANVVNDVPTLDFPAAAPAKPDKALWTIPGISTADITIYAVTLAFAAMLLAACAFSSARSRVIRPSSGGWRAAGRPLTQTATTVLRFSPLSRLLR